MKNHDNTREPTDGQDSKIHHTGGPDSDMTDSLIISGPAEPFGEGRQATTTEGVTLEIDSETGEFTWFGGLFRPREDERRPPDPILSPVEISAYIDFQDITHEFGDVQVATKEWDDDRNGWYVEFLPIPRAE